MFGAGRRGEALPILLCIMIDAPPPPPFLTLGTKTIMDQTEFGTFNHAPVYGPSLIQYSFPSLTLGTKTIIDQTEFGTFNDAPVYGPSRGVVQGGEARHCQYYYAS